MNDAALVAGTPAEQMSDPARRLPGENLAAAADARQAQHWIRTYSTLIACKRRLLDLGLRFAQAAEPEVGRAIGESDIILLEVQLSRFEQKRDYWMLRAAELAGRQSGPR